MERQENASARRASRRMAQRPVRIGKCCKPVKNWTEDNRQRGAQTWITRSNFDKPKANAKSCCSWRGSNHCNLSKLPCCLEKPTWGQCRPERNQKQDE